MVIPRFHILLGIGNKLQKCFNTYVSERLELLQLNKVEAMNNTILSQIELQNLVVRLNTHTRNELWLF